MKEIRLCEIRAAAPAGDEKSLVLQGMPIVFDSPTQITDMGGSYIEVIRAGALDNADLSDVRLLVNHDASKIPLARTPRTMQLEVTPAGMTMKATLPDTEAAREVYEAVKRRDLSGMSFAFTIPEGGDEYNPETNTRTIRTIGKLYECSVVSFPAYSQTSVEARNAQGASLEAYREARKAQNLINIILERKDSTMKFDSVQAAFNYYRNYTIEALEQRAREIQAQIDGNAQGLDITSANIELRGIMEAKENAQIRSMNAQQQPQAQGMNIITGMKPQQGGAVAGDVLDSKEYRSAFIKNLLGQELTAGEKIAFDAGRRDMEKRSETPITSSTAPIPTAMLNEIISKARTQGGLLAECRAFAVPSNVSIPVMTPNSAAAWHTEGAAVEADGVSPAYVTFAGNEIIKVFSISEKARKMSIAAFESYLVNELSACVLDTINAALINGTGSGQGTGIETAITWATTGTGKNCIQVAANADIAYADIVAAFALLKRGYAQGAKIACNNATLYNVLYGMMDEVKRPVFIQNPQSDSVGKVLGHEIIVDDYIADNVFYIADFAHYMSYNLVEGITIESSRESSFRKGMIDYRAMAIADCKPLVNDAFIKVCKASS